jgi:hypothetical protein
MYSYFLRTAGSDEVDVWLGFIFQVNASEYPVAATGFSIRASGKISGFAGLKPTPTKLALVS